MTNSSDGLKQRSVRRWLVGVVLATVAIALAVWLSRESDAPQPVAATTLETNALERLLGRGAWRDLGFRLPAKDAEALQLCESLTHKVGGTVNGVSAFTADVCREELTKILDDAPDCFYAEYLLGLWHQLNGKPAEAEAHYASALATAPVVLVQRFELDGRPAAGIEAPELQVECNRVEGGSLDSSLKLTFFKLTTDSDGCVRLPVYRTVYRLTSAASPAGFDSHWAITGWFQSRGRIGVLPAAVLTPKR